MKLSCGSSSLALRISMLLADLYTSLQHVYLTHFRERDSGVEACEPRLPASLAA
jgi:hypothetical protein